MGTSVKNNKYVVDYYSFSTRAEYDRALKEKETISYITANTNMSDMRAVLKVYNRAVEKKSFQTVIGLEFIRNMRKRLIGSGFVTEETIEPVPVVAAAAKEMSHVDDKSLAESKAQKYKKLYEESSAGLKMRNIIIAFLVIIIIAMVVITYKTKYSIFTYFTDYKTQMEEELVDKYEKWEKELDDREKKLDSREKILEDGDKKTDSGNEGNSNIDNSVSGSSE